MLMQLVGCDAPLLLKLIQLFLDDRPLFGLLAGFAQNAHDFLADGGQYVVCMGFSGQCALRREAGRIVEFVDQLIQRDVRIFHQGFHGADVLQRGVDVDRIINLEYGFADLIASAGGAADHLLVQDPRTDAAQEDQMANPGHVDAGGEQVYGNRNAGETLVLVVLDELRDFVRSAGDLAHRRFVVVFAVHLLEGIVEQALDHVGVQIGGAKDHCLFIAERVDLLRQLPANDLVESLGDHALVEALHVEAEFIVQLGYFDFTGGEIDGADRLALFKLNAVLREQCFIAYRRLVVNQPVIGHGFAIGIREHRFAENIRGVLGWGRGEADLDRVKIVERATIAGKILGLIAHRQLAFRHVLIERIATMRFVDDDAIELVHAGSIIRLEYALDHGLHRRDMNTGFGFGCHIAQLGDIVELGQGHVLFKQRFMKHIGGLVA